MKWLLVLVGVSAFVVAVAVLATTPRRDRDPYTTGARPSGSQGTEVPSPGGEGAAEDPAAVDGDSNHPLLGAEDGSSTEPVLPARMPLPRPPSSRLGYTAALGRPTDLSYPPPDDRGSWSWPAFPARGRFRFLVRSNLGGVDVQRWLQGAWHSEDADRIVFTALGDGEQDLGGCVVRRSEGIWKAGAEASCPHGVLDAARVIASVRESFAAAGELAFGQDLRFAGMPIRLWAGDAQRALFVAPDDAGRPPSSAYPRPDRRWFDLRCWLAQDGSWQGLEYLQGSPSSPDEPGFTVRRLVLMPTSDVD